MKLIIVATKKDIDIFKRFIEDIKRFVTDEIVLVTQKKNISIDDDSIQILDEDEIVPGLTFSAVENMVSIRKHGKGTVRVGWYFQQFLKMGYSLITDDDYYMVWDADTVPINNIDMFDENGRPYFNLKVEYNAIYFDTIKALIGLNKNEEMSFISENMIFDTLIMKELIAQIENNQNIAGGNYWEKIINAIPEDRLVKNSFSEFETYGTYVTEYYRQNYAKRKFSSYRFGRALLGSYPTYDELRWLSKQYDAVAFEKWDYPTPILPMLLKFRFCRKIISIETSIGIVEKWRYFYREGMGSKMVGIIKNLKKQ